MINPREREILRYLTVTGDPDQTTLNQIQSKWEDIHKTSRAHHLARIFPIASITEDTVALEGAGLIFESRSLATHLAGASHVALMAVTLGQAVDRQIIRDGYRSSSEALVTDAVASAYVEERCDQCEAEIRSLIDPKSGLTSRFSPGYADLPLNANTEILRVLQTAKTIGLTSNDSHLLIPLKSVVAIIGIIPNGQPAHPMEHGCAGSDCSRCVHRYECPYLT